MEMMTISVTVPKEMVPYLDDRAENRSFERNAMMLYPFIRNLTLSHGRAAEILGVHKFDLIDYYASLGLPYLSQPVGDLDDEIADIHRLEGAGK